MFLSGHRKAGTTLLLNLFDNHPQLSVYPVDINILYAYFPQYTENAKYSNIELEQRLDKVVFKDLEAIDKLKPTLDINKFRNLFFSNINKNDLRFLEKVIFALLSSFAKTLNTDKTKTRYHVVKETSIELYACKLAKIFTNSRFINLIRDPRDNYAAIKSGLEVKYKNYSDSDKTLLFSILTRCFYGFQAADLNSEILDKSVYRNIRFEDLVSNPEQVTFELSSWLDIENCESLQTPTVLGQPTMGNNFDNEKKYSIDKKNVGRWKERISYKEASLIEAIFSDSMQKFGYQCETKLSDRAESMADYYQWFNYKYLYFDRFETSKI